MMLSFRIIFSKPVLVVYICRMFKIRTSEHPSSVVLGPSSQ